MASPAPSTLRASSLFVALAAVALAPYAYAHHPMGGVTPSTFVQGLLSGFGHPIIGLDHLAFIIGVGLLSAMFAKQWLMPLAFVAATVAGTVLHLMSLNLPAAELVIAMTVAVIGVLAFSGWRVAAGVAVTLFALAGVFHGYAYGEAVVGAEATPLAAYLLGFCFIQYAIATVVMLLVDRLGRAAVDLAGLHRRIGGGIVAGVGFVFLAENLFA